MKEILEYLFLVTEKEKKVVSTEKQKTKFWHERDKQCWLHCCRLITSCDPNVVMVTRWVSEAL